MPAYTLRLTTPLTGAQFQSTRSRPQTNHEGGVEVSQAMQQELKLLSQSMRTVDQRMTEQHHAVQALIAGLQRDVTDMATAIAVQVIGEQEVSPERVQQLVLEMVTDYEVGDSPQVYLHPADHQLLERVDQAHPRSYLTHTDTTLERGSCRVEGPRFGFLRHWKHQVAAIRESLLEQLGESRTP